MSNPFKVLQAARMVSADVSRLLDDRSRRMIHRAQLRDSAQSIPANIREGLGRDPGPDRNKSYRTARGSAEETDEHLLANFQVDRLPPKVFWPLHHRLTMIVNMLDAILAKK